MRERTKQKHQEVSGMSKRGAIALFVAPNNHFETDGSITASFSAQNLWLTSRLKKSVNISPKNMCMDYS
jgi:hypothetical protein